MRKTSWLIITLLTFFAAASASAQSVRSLSGTLSLDVGPSLIDRDIEITINNHSFIVIPLSFAIIRPIVSSKSIIVRMPRGTSQVDYAIDNIITGPVDYSIAIRCLGCTNDMPNQFYTPNGNASGLVLSAYIDPLDLPTTLDLMVITRATIKGEIQLDNVTDRDLQFELTVFSSESSDRILATVSPITLASGENSVSYSINGLNRSIAPAQYRVKLRCLNCIGQSRKTQFFANSLSPNQNHSDVDFFVTDIPILTLAPILLMLLE